MPAKTPASTPSASQGQTIPVRLSILVRIDPDKWEQPAPEVAEDAEPFDADKVIKGLVSAGIPEETARTMAEQLAPKPAEAADNAHAPSVVRSQVREYLLSSAQQLAALVSAGATVVDADRQPKLVTVPSTSTTK